MADVRVDRGPDEPALQFQVNEAGGGFRLETERIAARTMSEPDALCLDLLDIASAVFAVDGTISRGGRTRPDGGKDWRRRLDFRIGVRRPDLWQDETIKKKLTDAIQFLTEDDVSFEFHEAAPKAGGSQSFLNFDANAESDIFDAVVMFSGGLDSLTGAIDVLSTTTGRIALVTHLSAQKLRRRQMHLANEVSNRFPGRVLHVPVLARRKGVGEASETTQRSRSFLFMAMGFCLARLLGTSRLLFCENGIVSQNLPINGQVIGAMATRTTHPLSLALFQSLLDSLAPNTVRIENPYTWLTKTDVVERLASRGAASLIRRTVSCTHVRDQDTLLTHCGTCSQCLDRRFAIIAAGQADQDPDEQYATDVLLGAPRGALSRTLAVDWTRHALRLAQLGPQDFLSTFNLELTRIFRGLPQISPGQALHMSYDLQQRHGRAVTRVLEAAIAKNAARLARQDLPPSCLLVSHLADPAIPALTSNDRRVEARVTHEGNSTRKYLADGDILVSDPTEPLEVSFEHNGSHSRITVRNLGSVGGQPAHAVCALKSTFDEDRVAGRSRDQCRYVTRGDLANRMVVSKEAASKNVERCRTSLAEYYQEVYGVRPPAPLLVQNKDKKGYRLDPTIRSVKPED